VIAGRGHVAGLGEARVALLAIFSPVMVRGISQVVAPAAVVSADFGTPIAKEALGGSRSRSARCVEKSGLGGRGVRSDTALPALNAPESVGDDWSA